MDKILISNGVDIRPEWTDRIAVSYDLIGSSAINLTSSLEAGGSLIANTAYYYKVVAIMKKLITVFGDGATQITAITLSSFDAAKYFWRLWDVAGERYFEISKNQSFSDIVAKGHRTGDGVMTLLSFDDSGVVGSVTVAYTADDTSGNSLVITSNVVVGNEEETQTTDGVNMSIKLDYDLYYGELEAYKIYRGMASGIYDGFFYTTVNSFTDDGTDEMKADEFWFKDDIISVNGIFVAPTDINGVVVPGRSLLSVRSSNNKNSFQIDVTQVSNHPTWNAITQTANSTAQDEFNAWL